MIGRGLSFAGASVAAGAFYGRGWYAGLCFCEKPLAGHPRPAESYPAIALQFAGVHYYIPIIRTIVSPIMLMALPTTPHTRGSDDPCHGPLFTLARGPLCRALFARPLFARPPSYSPIENFFLNIGGLECDIVATPRANTHPLLEVVDCTKPPRRATGRFAWGH